MATNVTDVDGRVPWVAPSTGRLDPDAQAVADAAAAAGSGRWRSPTSGSAACGR